VSLQQTFKDCQSQELLYDWRFTDNQFVLMPCPLTYFFFQLNPCSHSPYVTSSLTRGWVCLLWVCLTFRQVYVSHIYHVIENSSLCTTYKSSVSPSFAKQIRSILFILCYNGSLVDWTVVSLTAAKLKPLIFSYVWFRLVLCCEHYLRSSFCMTSACFLHSFIT
jgi:hypothetical protein